MGVHIFSGSLIRFYTNNWENEIARMSRENGWGYSEVFSGPTPQWPTREEASERLSSIRASLAAKLGLKSGQSLWDDDTPLYDTKKLHAEARRTILLLVAHLHRPDLPMPSATPADAEEDPAYAEAPAKGYLIGPIAAFDSSLIIRGDFETPIFVESPLREKVLTCSTELLRAALRLAETFWDGRTDPVGWTERGVGEPEEFRHNAEYAFGVYTRMLEFSDQNGTAIAVW